MQIRRAVGTAFTLASQLVCAAVCLGVLYGMWKGLSDILAPDVAAWLRKLGPVWAAAAGLAAAALTHVGRSPGRLLARLPARAFAGLVFAVALGAGIAAHFAIQRGVPDVPDEFSYLHQARGFADGVLAPASPPLPDFHYVSWGVHDRGLWYSVFPPGYGVFLAAGVKLGVPWIVNPLLGALLALVLFAFARDLSDGDGLAPRAGVMIFLASWFPLMQAGSFMAHPMAALCTGLACLGAWRGIVAGGSLRWGAAAGAALAGLAATRPLNAVILAGAAAPALLHAVAVRAIPWRRFLPPLLAAAPILLAYGLYNRAITGSATLAPQERYMQLKEERGDCFRLGFGPGVGQCPITQNTNFGPRGYQPVDARRNTALRLDAYLRYSFALAPLAALPALGALLGALGAAPRRRAWLCFLLLASIFGYALFFYHGVTYGARFLYETFPFVALLGGAAIADLARRLRRWPRLAAGLGAALVTIYATGLWATWPLIEEHAGRRMRTGNGAALTALSAPELAGGVVFVDQMVYPALMTFHPDDIPANHPIVVRDNGDAANAGFMRLYPDRKPFRFVGLGPKAVALSYPAGAPIRNEGGGLYPLEIAENGFGDRVTNPQVFKLPLSMSDALRFRGRAAGARFAFPTWTPDSGDLFLRLAIAVYPQGPTIDVLVDGQQVGAAIETRAEKPAVALRELPLRLAAGRHWIEIRLRAKGTFFLDYAELAR